MNSGGRTECQTDVRDSTNALAAVSICASGYALFSYARSRRRSNPRVMSDGGHLLETAFVVEDAPIVLHFGGVHYAGELAIAVFHNIEHEISVIIFPVLEKRTTIDARQHSARTGLSNEVITTARTPCCRRHRAKSGIVRIIYVSHIAKVGAELRHLEVEDQACPARYVEPHIGEPWEQSRMEQQVSTAGRHSDLLTGGNSRPSSYRYRSQGME